MKYKLNIWVLVFSFFIASSYSVNAQNTEAALKYLEELSSDTKDIKTQTWRYLRLLAKSKRVNRVEKQRAKLLTTIKDAKTNIEAMSGFEGDNSLKTSFVEFLDLQYKVLKEDYDEIMEMEAIIEQSYDELEAYILVQQEASNKLQQASTVLQAAESAFAMKHNIKLSFEQDKTSIKIQNASNALEYYNNIYLTILKCNMQESYAIEALSNNDLNSLQQNINSLKQFADEGLAKIKDTPNYKGSGQLKYMAKRVLNFYTDEAEKDLPFLLDFLLESEAFAKLTKKIESTPKKKLKKKDIDDYNKAGSNYNKSVKKFNDTQNKLNKDKTKHFASWEDEIEKFMKKYVD